MANGLPPPPAPSASRRLNGWKEIASYFGKGVRTVQRWEKELGLPVRRAGTEIVYAFEQELEAWLARTGGREGDEIAQAPKAESESTKAEPNRHRRQLPLLIGVGAALCVAIVAGLSWGLIRPASQRPYSARIENHVLRAFARDGRFLWDYAFATPLRQESYSSSAVRRSRAVTVQDIDSDGSAEVLFHTALEAPTDEALFCLNGDGSERFVHRPKHRVRYGNETFSGPWRPLTMRVIEGAPHETSIWLASHHQDEFPSVIEKLDADGTSVGQFWNAGTIDVLEPWTLNGRRVVLAGGANNDSLGATLVVLDAQRPSGRSPALRDKYLCADCPKTWPIAYLILPPSDIQRTLDVTSAVEEIRVSADGTVTVLVANDISVAVPDAALTRGGVRYVFDANLRPVRAELDSSFRIVHNELYRRGLLDHAADSRDERALWPVLRWTAGGFREIAPPD